MAEARTLRLFPARLNRRQMPELLADTEARKLQRVECADRPGQTSRAPGQVRAANFTGVAVSITSVAVMRRADGGKLLVYADAGGTMRAQVGVEPSELAEDFE